MISPIRDPKTNRFVKRTPAPVTPPAASPKPEPPKIEPGPPRSSPKPAIAAAPAPTKPWYETLI